MEKREKRCFHSRQCAGTFYRRLSFLYPAPDVLGGGTASTCLVIEQMWPRSRQLASQCARLAAESSIVFIRAETGFNDQLAVGKELVIRTVRVQINTCNQSHSITPSKNEGKILVFNLPSTARVIMLVESPIKLTASQL